MPTFTIETTYHLPVFRHATEAAEAAEAACRLAIEDNDWSGQREDCESSGDGACFEGQYRYAAGTVRKIHDHAPKDTELHRIAAALQAVQRRNFFQLHAGFVHRDRYYHEYCMAIAVERDSPSYQEMTADAEETVIEALRDLARWLYRQLEREYDYQTSDAVVDEAILANGYTFTANGRRFG
jgi:hypothetical protein